MRIEKLHKLSVDKYLCKLEIMEIFWLQTRYINNSDKVNTLKRYTILDLFNVSYNC